MSVLEHKRAPPGGGEHEKLKPKPRDAPAPEQPQTSRAFALAPPPLGPSAAAAADERPAGASLDARTRARLERGFGAPLDGVRVHAGARLPALAAAEGRDIYFAAGAYEPGTLRGDALIAHEVAHVLQQRAASNGVEPVTADVERDATASSVAALASTLVPGALPARPSLTTPLALRRCNGGGGDRPGGGVAYATAPEVSTEQFEAGNVPGERPVTSLLAGGVNQFRFDGDGDGMKELDGRMRTISSWPNGAARVIEFSLTQLSSNTTVTHTFEIPEQPVGFGLIPIVQEFTDGRRPTRIDLLGGGLRQELVFYPPERTPQAVTYRAELSSGTFRGDRPPIVGQSQTFRFPAETTPLRRVWQPDAPTHVGDIWALDVTAGPYGDRFRLTFRKSDPAAAGAIFGVSVLEREGPVAGDRNDISVSGPLSVTVLPTDGIRLALDLNADGRADLELFDRIYQPSGTDPASPSEERSHDMLAIGPALPSGATFSFAVTRWTTTAGSSTPRAQDEAVASAARAITGLQQQQRVGTLTGRAGTLQGEIDDVELLLTQVRAQAHSGHMISDALFRTWDTIARDLIVVRVQLDAGGVNPELQRNAATHAGEFYDALDAETRSERRMSAGRTGVYVANVYTGESGNLSNPDFQTPRVVIVSAIQQGRWDDAVAAYRRLAEGLDRWIAERYRRAGAPDPLRPESLVGAQAAQLLQLRRGLEEIRRNNPTRIAAVYHPHEQYMTTGRIAEVPLSLYYWRDGGTWHLRDVTDSDGPHETATATADQREPPAEMFRSLAESPHYPRGTIYYWLPSGTAGQVSPTGPGRWRTWVTWIGIGLGLLGLGLVTFGTGTVAVLGAFALGASAVAGGGMAVVDLVERYRHGNLTAATAILDGAQIVASISGIAALRLGRLALTARAAAAEAAAVGAPLSEQSQLVLQWARAQARVVPIAAVNLGADAVTLAVMVPEAAAQYDAIENSTADPETKRRAKIMLLGQLALTLGLTSLSVRGNVREITLGRDLNVELVSGLPVLTPVGRSVVGEQVVTRRPAVAAETTETSFRAAAEQQVAGIRTRLPGPAGETLAEVEDQALRTAWRVEESRRILNPIFEGTAPLAAADRNLKSALLRFSTQTIDTLNNPGLTQAQKQARLRSLVDAFEAANAQLRGHVDFAGPRRAISEVGAAAGEGIYVVDARGGLTAGEGGRSAGSFQELVDRVLQANNVNVFHGIDTEYVLVVNAPNARGFAEVHILTRPRGAGAPPAQLPPQIPGPPRATGRFIVDIGAGESAFAIDMVPPNERAGAIVVQTELPQTFANPAQARRGLGIEQVAPRGDRGSVLVLADALQNLELLFGTPATGQGVRRLFINNVNAHYSPAQYERLARALGRVAGAGTRVEVQWDRSPERTGQPQGSRGHIEGPALRAALQQFSGRTFHYETAPPVSYPYSIQPSRRVGGAVDPNPPTPPDPTGPLGGRAIITFE